jgi:hypothetical protein
MPDGKENGAFDRDPPATMLTAKSLGGDEEQTPIGWFHRRASQNCRRKTERGADSVVTSRKRDNKKKTERNKNKRQKTWERFVSLCSSDALI